MTYEDHTIISMYKDGKSINEIARNVGTYPTTIRRLLLKHSIELRHDNPKKGETYVANGEQLIEWAKSQGRLVTKTELAKFLGKTKLSPSYFIKYPELGQYVQGRSSKNLDKYTEQLYTWLQKHNIPYKAGDRTALGVTVDALLLGDYKNVALQIVIRPTNVSTKVFNKKIASKYERATKRKIHLLFLDTSDFELYELDNLLPALYKLTGH